MYCANCGAGLSESQSACPLCGTEAYHPKLPRRNTPAPYPENRRPKARSSAGANGALLILFLLPLLICFLCDLQRDSRLQWFGYAAGGLLLAYIVFCLPLWFRKPHPIIFVPCDFAAAIVYLLYIQLASGGSWFLGFAFPLAGALGILCSAVVTLLVCLPRAWLYICGGGLIALGGLVLLTEFLLKTAFGLCFVGWSFYPLAALVLLGGLFIYLGINASAREMMGRKLFF